MANASYAPINSGPFAYAIGWTIFPGQLDPNTSTIVSSTLNDGSIVTFTLTNTPIVNTKTFSGTTAPTFGGAPFGNVGGYAGVTGNVVFTSTPSDIFESLISINNMIVTTSLGATISNYTVILTDGEGTSTGEEIVYVTDGTPFEAYGLLGILTSPSYVGFNTTTVTLTGTNITGPYGSINAATNNPKNISVRLSSTTGGIEAFALGVALTKAETHKSLNGRAYASDQFNISTTWGTISATTITTGNAAGAQPQSNFIYVTPDSISSIPLINNETMAPGSGSTLSTNYISTIQNSNLTTGGTSVPATVSLGQNVTISLGDYILSTIVNTVITSTLVSTKIVDKTTAIPGETLTYTVSLNNLGPLTIGNTTFIDTIPTGSSFVANSFLLNGSPIPGNPSPPTGINIGTIPAGATTTVSFQVLLQNNLPIGTIVQNNSTAFGFNNIIPGISVTIASNSNTVTTRILGSVTLSSAKSVSQVFADVGNTLVYTITIQNTGNTTATNVIFSDTTPNDLTFVVGSLTQNGIPIPGNPNPPGVLLSNIGPGGITTVGFRLLINTIPNQNPILNSATINVTYIVDPLSIPVITSTTSSNTNIVSTQVNNASISNINKSVDKLFGTCGDTITYTITVPNTGNVTATNVVVSDTVPNGTTFVPGSVLVNGVPAGGTPSNIILGSIAPGSTSTVSFRVIVQC